VKTRAIATDDKLLSRIRLDPARELIGAQCSGTLLLAKLGPVGDLPACTDLTTKPWIIEAGVDVIDAPFIAHGNGATAGGPCFPISGDLDDRPARLASRCGRGDALCGAGGEKALYVERALGVVAPFVEQAHAIEG